VAYGVICTLYAAGSLVAGGALTLIAFENHKFAAVVAGIVAGLTFVLFMISGHLAALNVKYFVLHPPKNKRPMAALSWGITNLVSGISSALRTTEGEISEENERSKKAALTLLLLGVLLLVVGTLLAVLGIKGLHDVGAPGAFLLPLAALCLFLGLFGLSRIPYAASLDLPQARLPWLFSLWEEADGQVQTAPQQPPTPFSEPIDQRSMLRASSEIMGEANPELLAEGSDAISLQVSAKLERAKVDAAVGDGPSQKKPMPRRIWILVSLLQAIAAGLMTAWFVIRGPTYESSVWVVYAALFGANLLSALAGAGVAMYAPAIYEKYPPPWPLLMAVFFPVAYVWPWMMLIYNIRQRMRSGRQSEETP
jgi:hypothetical protein